MQRSIPFLWGLVAILLILVLALLYELNRARLTVIQTLDEVETTLDDLANEVIVYNIDLNQPVPIKADIPFNQTMEIPLNTVIPIDQEVTVPFQTGSGEIELELPIKVDFPINIVVPVNFNENINVDTTVQLNTTVPVEIDIAKTPLLAYLNRARQNVSRLKGRLVPYGKAQATAEEAAPAAVDASARFDSQSKPSKPSESSSETPPLVATPAPALDMKADLTDTDSSLASTDLQVEPDGSRSQLTDLGLCEHPYWPLQPGTAWTYNSSHTSYVQQVIEGLNNQIRLMTTYEGQPIQLGLTCSQEGLEGGYLGDMRRLTEFGQLEFSSLRGLFLPRSEVMEEIGTSWAQELEITGQVEGRYGNKSAIGHVTRGRGTAFYTPTGFETLKTPLGPREALRIEQKLDLELEIDFDLDNRAMPATEIVKLTNVYWFVKGIGLVKTHWQGGTIRQQYDSGTTLVDQQFSVPALAEEYLVFVCVLSDQETSECMSITGISQADVTVPPESELVIQGFVFAEDISNDDRPTFDDSIASQERGDPPATDELPEDQSNSDDEGSALLVYAKAVADIGREIREAGEAFGESAIAYRNGEMTLDEFQNKFSSFKSKVRGLLQQIDRLSPPPAAEAIHQELTGGLAKCNDAIDLMDEWFDNRSNGTKEATALLVAACMDQVNEATSELEALVYRQ